MGSVPLSSPSSDCKALRVEPIRADVARRLCSKLHYSGRYVNNSNIHLGVVWDGRLEGVMQFGPSMRKEFMAWLVRDTKWDGFCELNRMAFSNALPRNSESRALAVAFRLLSKQYPSLEWVVSFADAAQCGDGTIYRASGFVLTGIKKNRQLLRFPDGRVTHKINLELNRATRMREEIRMTCGTSPLSVGALAKAAGAAPLSGFQLRYVRFLRAGVQERLTVPIIPFARIGELGARMYRGERLKPSGEAPTDQVGEGGSTPTQALHDDILG